MPSKQTSQHSSRLAGQGNQHDPMLEDGGRVELDEDVILASPEGAAAFYSVLLEYLVFTCEFDQGGVRRSNQRFRSKLLTEAKRMEAGKDWRGENPALAQLMSQALRDRAENLSSGRRGPKVQNPARPILDSVVAGLREELRKRGREDLADTILDPGTVPPVGSGQRGKPTGLSTAKGVAEVLAECAHFPLPTGSLDRAVDDIRRSERRKRTNESSSD